MNCKVSTYPGRETLRPLMSALSIFPQGSLGAAAGSSTIESQIRPHCGHWRALPDRIATLWHLHLAGTARARRAALGEAEPGAGSAGPAPRSGAALIYERLNSAVVGLGG